MHKTENATSLRGICHGLLYHRQDLKKTTTTDKHQLHYRKKASQFIIEQSKLNLDGKLVADDLSALHLHLLVQPLPVTAALHPTFTRATSGAGVEATHAVHVQTVTHVLAVDEQSALAVVDSALHCRQLSEWEEIDSRFLKLCV